MCLGGAAGACGEVYLGPGKWRLAPVGLGDTRDMRVSPGEPRLQPFLL